MTNAKVYQWYHDDKNVEEHCFQLFTRKLGLKLLGLRCLVFRETDFSLKKTCWTIPCLPPLWRAFIWIYTLERHLSGSF